MGCQAVVVCGPPELGFEVRLDGPDIVPLVVKECMGKLGARALAFDRHFHNDRLQSSVSLRRRSAAAYTAG